MILWKSNNWPSLFEIQSVAAHHVMLLGEANFFAVPCHLCNQYAQLHCLWHVIQIDILAVSCSAAQLLCILSFPFVAQAEFQLDVDLLASSHQ